MNVDRDSIGAALGRIPSGCSILTVQHHDRATGVLVSWVQQAAFEPPMLTVCLKRGRPAVELVDGAKRFVLNVIGQDPTAMFKHFGKGFSLADNAFEGLAVTPNDFGPMIDACIAHLGCDVRQKVAAGDHDVYVVAVQAGDATAGGTPYTHLRKSGLTY